MRDFIGPHEARDTTDFLELALGTPLDLWLGEDCESDEERAARLDAARDILADDPGMFDHVAQVAVETIGDTLPELLRLVPAVRTVVRPRRASFRSGVAA